jgi:hypothetical protein
VLDPGDPSGSKINLCEQLSISAVGPRRRLPICTSCGRQLGGDGDDMRQLPLSMRKINLARLLARRSDGIFVAPFAQGEIDRTCFGRPAGWVSRVWSRNGATVRISRAGRSTGSRSRTASTRRCRGWWMGRGDANVFNPNRQPAKGYRRSQFEAIWHSYCAEDGTTAHSGNISLLLADDSTA